MRDTISDLVAVGFSGMKVVSDGANLTLARVSPQSISTYIDESGTKFYKEIHTFKESTSGLSGSASVSYALERIFFVGYNQVKLYRLTNQVGSTEFTVVGQSSQIGTEVPLSSTLLTKNMQEIERTGLTFPAFSYLGDKSLGFFPEIISLVNAIDRNITMIEATFMAHAEPWMIMRNIQIPSHAVDNMTGKIAPEKLTGRVLSGADGDASIDFATPSLENITIEMEHISSLTRQAYAIMNIPEEFQGIEVTSSAKGM